VGVLTSGGRLTATENVMSTRSDYLGPFFGAIAPVPLRLGANNTEYMRITSAGNVGIGTAFPGTRFNVEDSGSASGHIADFYRPSLTDGNYVDFYLGKSANAGAAGVMRVHCDKATPANAYTSMFVWGDAPVTGIVVKKGGRVGIGTTTPGNRLDVEDSGSGSGRIATFYRPALADGNYVNLSIGKAGLTGAAGVIRALCDEATPANAYMALMVWGDLPDKGIVIKKGGNVGIGTTSPSEKLHVNGYIKTSRLHIRDNSLEEYTTDANTNVVVNYNGYNGGTTQSRDFDVYDGKHNLVMQVEGATRRVGIGTATPVQKLDVVGNIAVSGTVDGVDVGVTHGTYVQAVSGSLSLTMTHGTVVNYTEKSDPKGIFNSGTGIASVNTSGVYLVSASCFATMLTDLDLVDLEIHTDTGNVASAVARASSDVASLSINYIVTGASNISLQAKNGTASRGVCFANLSIIRIK
jgi:hypothetical protein